MMKNTLGMNSVFYKANISEKNISPQSQCYRLQKTNGFTKNRKFLNFDITTNNPKRKETERTVERSICLLHKMERGI